MAPTAPHIHFASRAALRRWLAAEHASHGAIWLVYDKASPAAFTRALTYDAIVEEALCFGWIDSLPGRVSASQAKLYLSPRKPKSVWSALNKRRVEALIESGRMHPAGLAKIAAAKADGSWTVLDSAEALKMPAELVRALKATGGTENFAAFPPGVRKYCLSQIALAKTIATRERRVQEIAAAAAKNLRWGQAGKAQAKAAKR